jgi:hypothetical protein
MMNSKQQQKLLGLIKDYRRSALEAVNPGNLNEAKRERDAKTAINKLAECLEYLGELLALDTHP